MPPDLDPNASRPSTPAPASSPATVTCFAGEQAWIEGKAREQLDAVAALPGVVAVAGMPDLNPGKYGPVGCSVLSSNLHPELAGSDIGCGMGLYTLDTPARKIKADKAAERLEALEGPWDGHAAGLLAEAGLSPGDFDQSLGTVGGGNHFCELQAIEEFVDAEAAARLGLDAGLAYILVHSGSRGLGASILHRFVADGVAAIPPQSESAAAYMTAHDDAVRWAEVNRRLIARRAAEALRADVRRLADLPHNLIERTSLGLLHRKGTAPADRGPVPIPGSRGTLSYLVEPLQTMPPEALVSLAHGAGRKHDRASMHGRIRTSREDREALTRNPFGGRIVCTDKNLLVEEAPEAYKSIERVIADLVQLGLARVVATFRPLVTFKTARDTAERRQGNRHRERDRTRR